MMYRFTIQASSPRVVRRFDQSDQSLADALQTLFPVETEFALLVGNWVYLPLNYKYDWSLIV